MTNLETGGSRQITHTRASFPNRGLHAAAAFLAVGCPLFLIVAVVGRHAIRPGPLPHGFGWLDGWVRWDAGWYHSVAAHGYSNHPGRQSSVAFFPTYPLMMRLLGHAFPWLYVAGVAITAIAGVVSATGFWTWCNRWLPHDASAAALGSLLLYPYSLYLFGAVYSDGLFLATTLCAFLLLERGHPCWAGLVGILATAGRPVGVAVVAGLAVRAVELAALRASHSLREGAQGRPRLRLRLKEATASLYRTLTPLRFGDFGVLVSAVGIGSDCLFLWFRFGDPVAFATVESAPGWQGSSGPRIWFKSAFFATLRHGSGAHIAKILAPALFCLVALLLLPAVRRRFGWGYTCYAGLIVSISVIGSKDFLACGRYLLAAFPLFAVVGALLAEARWQWVKPVVLHLLGTALVFTTVLYAKGFLLS